MELTKEMVKDYVDRIGPSFGYDQTHSPVFPKGNQRVCVVVRTAENGSTYGFDTVYLVWLDDNKQIQHKEIRNTRNTKDYIQINSVVCESGIISIGYGSGGSYSGSPWKTMVRIKIVNEKAILI